MLLKTVLNSIFVFLLYFQIFNSIAQTKDKMRQINLETTFTIKVNETIMIDNNLFFTFDGHSHKMEYENSSPTPLMINVKYKKEWATEEKELEKTYYMNGKPPFIWRWKNYLFVVISYEYGKLMEMKICNDNFED